MRKLGSHGPLLSAVGFGGWEAGGRGWGQNPPDAAVIAAVHAAIDAGVNWVDTAEIYGDGRSERLVGRALRGRRDHMLIATKVAPRPAGTGFRAREVRRALEGSLRRLRVDVVDLYQLHWPDEGVSLEETWEAMAALVDDGLVRWIGLSNFDRSDIERCEAIRHVDSIQPQLSLLAPKHRELAAWCGERGIGVVPYSPLGCGLLTGAFDATHEFPPDDWRSGKLWESDLYDALFAPGKIDRSVALVEGLRPLAKELGCSLTQLALAWVLAQPGVTSPIVGTRNAEHIREDAEAGLIRIPPAVIAQIEALIPTGPAFG